MKLSVEAKKELVRVVDNTWSAIAIDVLQCLADCEGKKVEAVTVDRESVCDSVLNYWETHGGKMSDELKTFLRSGSDLVRKSVRGCLKFSRYGL